MNKVESGDGRVKFPRASRAMDATQLSQMREHYEQVQRLLREREDQLLCLEIEAVFLKYPELLGATIEPPGPGGGTRGAKLRWSGASDKGRDVVAQAMLGRASRRVNAPLTVRAGSALSDAALALDFRRDWAPAWLAEQEKIAIDSGCGPGQKEAPKRRM